jgi:hypothetical protein
MLQKRLRNGAGAKDDEAIEADAASDSDSVTRRYEFYKYGGSASTFDVETGEAMCDKVGPDGIHGKGEVNVTTWDPQNPGETTSVKVDCDQEVVVGDYIGAQMEAVNIADIDADGVNDDQGAGDNCALRPNTNQRDSDNDGWGNVCDPDLDNNGIVNNTDLAEVKKKLNKTGAAAAHADLDGDGKVNFKDLAIVNAYMGKVPGPKTSELP